VIANFQIKYNKRIFKLFLSNNKIFSLSSRMDRPMIGLAAQFGQKFTFELMRGRQSAKCCGRILGNCGRLTKWKILLEMGDEWRLLF
jgi:hypothetical protein